MIDFLEILLPLVVVALLIILRLVNLRFLFGENSYLSLFMYYNLLGVAWLGAFLVNINVIGEARLSVISQSTKTDIFLLVTFAVITQLIFFIIYGSFKKKNKVIRPASFSHMANHSLYQYKIVAVILLFAISCYSIVKVFLFYKYSPVLLALKGDLIGAALMRADIQNGVVNVDLKYISKMISYFAFYLPIYTFVLNAIFKKRILTLLFFISLINAFILLGFDGQKSTILLLLLMLLVTRLYLFGFSFYILIYSFVFVSSVLLVFYLMLPGDFDLLVLIQRISDRLLSGQNQGMYFIYQYYEQSYTGIFSDFFFSGAFGLNEIKPDEIIASYIYDDTEHIVNVNTFYVGELLAFFGGYGALIFSIIIPVIIVFYVCFFDKLISKDFIIYWPMSLIFFTLLPINQSFQFLIYQKSFLYFMVFCILPVFVTFWVVKKLQYIKINSNV
ncbi:hypothetical protein [Shewanella vesiculosa]|uniref:hypothetical protein n=1 Tax=Shewanella vesiculosa TaxID=518738 RepID=UPI00384D21A9